MLWVVAAIVVAVGLWFIWRLLWVPFHELKHAVAAVAKRKNPPPITRASKGLFEDTFADFAIIADRLREQQRQLADEGFSLRAILGSMVEGIIIVDTTLRIRLANDALQTMFDLSQSPINRPVIEVFRDHELQSAMERSLRDVRPVVFEIQSDPRVEMGKPVRFYHVHVSPLIPAKRADPVGVLVVFNDVTEVRSLEVVRREFVANVSHEFRTPLAIISGYIETLVDGALDDREMAERSLNVMARHAKRLNLLIDDLLTISTLEHRATKLEFAAADLEDLINRVAEQLEDRIKAANTSIRMEIDASARIADIDTGKMEQVFFNLLSNAIQYGRREQAEILVTGRRRGEEIEIAISDNGPGIPYEDQPHIFERFYRVRKDRARDAGGTGLGLSIVKNVIRAHGGHVSLRSTPGAGATFQIHFPARHDAI